MSWLQIKNTVILKCFVLFYKTTFSQSDSDVQWKVNFIQQRAQWLDWEETPKHFLKPNLHQEKGRNHCLVVCCPSDPLQLSESQRIHCIWKVCSANWWDVLKTATPAAGIGQQNGPRSSPCHAWQHVTQPMLQRLNKLGYKLLPYLPDSPDLLPTDYHFFKHLNNFLQGKMLPQPAGGRKCFQWVCWILKQGFLCYRNKQTYCSLAKMCRL